MSLKVLYQPPDELLAVRIKDWLEQQGIEVALRSHQMPWYDGLARMMRPEWGEVLVLDEDYPRAKELLDDLLAVIEESSKAQDLKGPGDAAPADDSAAEQSPEDDEPTSDGRGTLSSEP